MANSFAAIIPYAYTALNIVSREMVGYTRVASRNAELSGAAMNEEIRVPVVQRGVAKNIAPSMQFPEGDDRTPAKIPLKITKSKGVEFNYTGEETLQVRRAGAGLVGHMQTQNIAEAMRTLTNEIETDLGGAFIGNSGAAIGTKGTMPFSSNHDSISAMVKYLNKSGSAKRDRVMVVGSSEAEKMRNLTNLVYADRSGTTETLREGFIGRIYGMEVHETAIDIETPTEAATGYVVDGKHAKDSVKLTVKTGSAKIAKGSIIKLAAHPTQYTVLADQTGAGDITIAEPGLTQEVPNTTAVTVINGLTNINMAFNRSSLYLGIRPPAKPEGGDAATNEIAMIDEVSGLVFNIEAYLGFHKNLWQVTAAWGVGQIKPSSAVVLYR